MSDDLKNVGDLRQGAAIIVLCVGAACGYGILHDLITTRVSLEYFTVWHPPIFGGTHDPTLLALGWGVIATWWVGLPLGCILALVSRHGSWPKRTARDLLPGLFTVLCVMAFCALFAGIIGFRYGRTLIPDLTAADPHLNADLFSHTASYFVGGFGGLVLSITVVVQRWKAMRSIRNFQARIRLTESL